MSPTGERRTPSGDNGPPKPFTPACWFCNAPDPGGFAVLGGPIGSRAKVPRCADGEGCQDGRIFHGPGPNPPHFPDEECSVCGPAARRGNDATRRRFRRRPR